MRRLGGAVARSADGADGLAGRQGITTVDFRRAEVQVREIEPSVVRSLGDRQPGRPDDSNEGDAPTRGGDDGRPHTRAYVDASVLAGRVRVGPVPERRDDGTADRPCPASAAAVGAGGSGDQMEADEEG